MPVDTSKRRSWNPAAFASFKSDFVSSPSSSSPRSSTYSDSSLLSPITYSTSPPQSRPSSLLIDPTFYSGDSPIPDTSASFLMASDHLSVKKPSIPANSTARPISSTSSTFPTGSSNLLSPSVSTTGSISTDSDFITCPNNITQPSNSCSKNSPAATDASQMTYSNNALASVSASHSGRKSTSSSRINRAKSLHIPSSSKRWSSSAVLDNNSSRLISSNSNPMPLTTSKWMHPEQEGALQAKLQQLARTENERLKAHEDIFLSTASPTTATPSSTASADPSNHQHHVPLPFAVTGPASAKRPTSSSHQRHLSLQPYYNSNHVAPEMSTTTSGPNTPISSTPSNLTLHLPLSASPIHGYSAASIHRHSSSTSSTTYRSTSPRTVARAAALATLNSESDPNSLAHSHQTHTNGNQHFNHRHQSSVTSHRYSNPFSPTPLLARNTHRHHASSSSSSSLSSFSDLHSESSPTVSTSCSSVSSPQSSVCDSENNTYRSMRANSLGGKRRDKPILKPTDSNHHIELSQYTKDSCTDAHSVPSGMNVPEGYFIISAAELDKLRGTDKDNSSTIQEPILTPSSENLPSPVSDLPESKEESSNPLDATTSNYEKRSPMDLQNALKSWRKTGDIMSDWMKSYKSPAAVIDLFSLLWTMLATGGESVVDKEETEETQKSGFDSELDSSEIDKVKDNSEVVPTREPKINESFYNSFKLTNIHDLNDVLRKAQQGVISTVGTSFIVSLIFIQVLLIALMVVAYVFGDIITTPAQMGVEYFSEYQIRKAKERFEEKKLINKRIKEEKDKLRNEKNNDKIEEAVDVDNKQPEPIVQSIPGDINFGKSNNNSSTGLLATSHNSKQNDNDDQVIKLKPVKKANKPAPEYIDPSVMLSNALKAKRAALKQAKRRSKH